jgi:GDP-4-dehydro-6-deoxy-D-mannose reductase
MHLFITGLGGFVGSRLARYWLARGGRVSGTYLGDSPSTAGVQAFEVDLLDGATLAAAIAEAAPDAVVHLAGLSHVGESWTRIPEYFRANVLGTENLLEAAGDRRVVVASSAEVYGSVPVAEQPIREDRRLDPHTPYALTKAAAERLALGRRAVVVRSFNLVGPGHSTRFALPAFAAQLAAIERGEHEPVLRVGNLTARRDFVHVEDGVEAYGLLAEVGQPGEIYNLASGVACSIGEALERLMAISGVAARIELDPERVRAVDLPLLVGDPARLRSLGWRPRLGLDDALAELWSAARTSAAR